MKKIKYLFGLLLFMCLLPNVDALSYDIDADIKKVDNYNNYNVSISLKNIKDTNAGIFACSMIFDYSDGVVLNGNIVTESPWNLTKGEIYVFDTATPVLSNGKIVQIPVKISKNGQITIKNISCSDGEVDVDISDKTVDLTYSVNNSNNNSSSGSLGNVDSNPQTGINFNIYIMLFVCIICIVSFVFIRKKVK